MRQSDASGRPAYDGMGVTDGGLRVESSGVDGSYVRVLGRLITE
jgi:hypothetical protein